MDQNAMSLAVQNHKAGRFREAEEMYRRVLNEQPDNAVINHYLGVIFAQTGRCELAIDLIKKAVALKPDYAEAHNNLGNAFKEAHQFPAAIIAYQRVLELRPDNAPAYYGNIFNGNGELDQAIIAYSRAINSAVVHDQQDGARSQLSAIIPA